MTHKARVKRILLGLACSALSFGGLAAAPAIAKATPQQPNFLIILADDLGFSDIGAFGGEIRTPNLDKLAKEGVRLTGFHTSSMCAPTRGQLLTGVDNHLNGTGQMNDNPNGKNVGEMTFSRYAGIPGYEGALRADVVTLPQILRDNGYRTVHSGKWHLGGAPEKDPSKRGFDHSFVLIHGSHDHFGREISKDPWDGKGYTYRLNGKTLDALPANFYSTDYFTDKLIEGLKVTKKADAKKPFFAYLAYTAPHWPLHAHPEDIAKYRGVYDAGYDVLREKRVARQVELGLIKAGTPAARSHEVRAWADVPENERKYYVASQEVFAAMVDRIDQNVGRIVEYLKSTGEYENTVILFHSDNGAAGRDFLRDKKPFEPYVRADNRPENIGAPNSFAAVGSGWAEAGSAPAKLYKRYQTEGGTRVVAFLNYQGLPKTSAAANGAIDGVYTHVRDVAPTFLELAGVTPHNGTYKGQKVQPISGLSQVAYWQGKADRVYPENHPVGGELYGSKSLRKGDWKLTSLSGEDWALYNIEQDPGETKDLSASHPEKLAELKADWATYVKQNGVLEDPKINALELGSTNPQ